MVGTPLTQHDARTQSPICHNSVTTQNLWFFQEKLLKVSKCYNFLWVQRRHNCSPAASFANCVMTLQLLKVHLQTFLSIPITQKWQLLSCNTLVANERSSAQCMSIIGAMCWPLLILTIRSSHSVSTRNHKTYFTYMIMKPTCVHTYRSIVHYQHSNVNVVYGGGDFALIFLAEYASILFMSLLFCIIFLGSDLYSFLFYFRLTFVSFLFVWVRGTMPRFRYDKLMYLAWRRFLPLSLNYLLFFCWC